MEKPSGKWEKLQFGSAVLHQNIRELTLWDDSYNEKGVVSFDTETRTGKGGIFGEELKIVNIDKQLYEIQCSERYSVNLSDQNIIEISSDGVELLNLRVPFDVSQSFYRYADAIIGDKLLFQVEISRNYSLFKFFRMILGLLTFGLIKQKFRPVIPNDFLEIPINRKSLVLCAMMAQLVYFPYDYDDWN